MEEQQEDEDEDEDKDEDEVFLPLCTLFQGVSLDVL
jgi:hypothetical protein